MADQFAQDCLKAHNEYRRRHGAKPLVWDQTISNFSQRWANTIAARNVMQHSSGSGYGENIYASMGQAVTGQAAVDSWYSEIKKYRYGDQFSTATGHFTQVVWKGSTKFGVGKATNGSGWTYVVANYSPPGNMQGTFSANVLPPGNYNIPDESEPKKTGIEGEVCDLVSSHDEESAESLANKIYQHLETKHGGSLWVVGVVSGAKAASFQNLIKGFMNWDGGENEDKDVVVYEFQHPQDEAEAQATVLNEAFVNKVKVAFLEAQREKEKPKEILEMALELYPELKDYQWVIFEDEENVSWSWKKNTKLSYFVDVIGDWLVVLNHPPKASAAVPTAPAPIVAPTVPATSTPSDSLSTNMGNLQVTEAAVPETSGPSSSSRKLCTFVTGKGALIEQHMYHCATCEMNDEETCICKVCVKLCHKGHDVSLSKVGKSFCDCGSDDTGICKANKK